MGKPCLALLFLCLLACAADPPRAPVEVREGEPGSRRPAPVVTSSSQRGSHTVMGGDTLYAIAWRYGIDYRTLARINGIAAPYTIYPGQTLRLTGDAPPPQPAATSQPAPTASAPVPKPSPPAIAASSPPVIETPDAPVSSWRWPTDGKVSRGFSGTVHKGIDIDGRAGDPVRATAAGVVVYAGSGIVGYGQLLIVKHNEVYLSAYGHNRKLLVKEGEVVETGQQIAEKGSSATNSVKLHFEIRRDGKPIDPKKLLPPR